MSKATAGAKGVVAARDVDAAGAEAAWGPVAFPAFRGVARTAAAQRAARATVVPVTWAHGSARYLKDGPRALLEASAWIGGHEEESGLDPLERGIVTVAPVEENSWERAVAETERVTGLVAASGRFPVVIGADRIASLGAVRTSLARAPGLTVVMLDAHRHIQAEGTFYGPLTNWWATAVKASGARLVMAGVRSMADVERRALDESGLTYFTARRLGDNPAAAAALMLRAIPGDVHVSVDFSVIDPCFFPAVEVPQPSGLAPEFLSALLRLLAASRRVQGIDFCGLAPVPGLAAPSYTAAGIVNRALAALAKAGRL